MRNVQGRRRSESGKTLKCPLWVYLDRGERELVHEAARSKGLSDSTWAANAVIEQAHVDLREYNRKEALREAAEEGFQKMRRPDEAAAERARQIQPAGGSEVLTPEERALLEGYRKRKE
jgi:hypothetical protein